MVGWATDYIGKAKWATQMLIGSLVIGIAAPFFFAIMAEGDPLTCFILQLVLGVLTTVFGAPMTP